MATKALFYSRVVVRTRGNHRDALQPAFDPRANSTVQPFLAEVAARALIALMTWSAYGKGVAASDG